MQAITQALDNEQLAPVGKPYRVVELYVRTLSGGAYVYEDAVDISADVKTCGRIRWKLDREEFGVWNTANVALTLRNDFGQWRQGNPDGYFPSPAIVNQTKVRIRCGYELEDGTTEDVYVFTGYVFSDTVANSDSRTVTVTVLGRAAGLKNLSAEDLATVVTNEAVGAGSGTVFTTAHTGVAGVRVTVKKGATAGGVGAATELNPSTQYSLSGANTYGSPLTITLVDALVAGQTLWVTYRYWYKDKTLEWIVEQLFLLAGVTSYQVAPAVFDAAVENTVTYTDKADWDTWTLTDCEDALVPGDVRPIGFTLTNDFSDGTYPGWTVKAGSFTAANSYLQGIGGLGANERVSRASAQATGTWEWRAMGVYPVANDGYLYFMSSSDDSNGNGYALKWTFSGVSPFPLVLTLYRVNLGALTQLATVNTGLSSLGVVRVTRTAAGLTTVALNGIDVMSATDNTFTTSSYEVLRTVHNQGAATPRVGIDDLYHSPSIIPGAQRFVSAWSLEGPQIDTTISQVSVGQVSTTLSVIPGVTATVQTADRASTLDPWGAWTDAGVTGVVATTKRYQKIRIAVTMTDASIAAATVALTLLQFYYYTSTITIPLVDLTGQNIWTVIEDAARLVNYEIGFDASDKGFYRPRSTSLAPVYTLDNSVLKELKAFSDGVDRVYTRVVVPFGSYYAAADSTSQAEAAPTSQLKYGTRELAISAGSLLPAAHVNVAKAVAPTVWNYTHVPRRRATASSRNLVHLELGDPVLAKYDDKYFKLWRWGDGDVVWGRSDVIYYGDSYVGARYSLWNVICRIEGIEFDTDTWDLDYDLVEAIS